MRPHSGRMTRTVFFVLTLMLTVTAPIEAASNTPAEAAVRTYNYALVSAEQLALARSAADSIFRGAGISLLWIDCRVPQNESGATCTDPLDERGDLLLRLTDGAPAHKAASGPRLALGASMLDRERRAGVLMTVDLLAVRTIAGQALADLPMLLGRAIAHEIGHLLLGTFEHPRAGLMRALWSHDELRGIRPASWWFSPREAAQMRSRLTAKDRSAN